MDSRGRVSYPQHSKDPKEMEGERKKGEEEKDWNRPGSQRAEVSAATQGPGAGFLGEPDPGLSPSPIGVGRGWEGWWRQEEALTPVGAFLSTWGCPKFQAFRTSSPSPLPSFCPQGGLKAPTEAVPRMWVLEEVAQDRVGGFQGTWQFSLSGLLAGGARSCSWHQSPCQPQAAAWEPGKPCAGRLGQPPGPLYYPIRCSDNRLPRRGHLYGKCAFCAFISNCPTIVAGPSEALHMHTHIHALPRLPLLTKGTSTSLRHLLKMAPSPWALLQRGECSHTPTWDFSPPVPQG